MKAPVVILEYTEELSYEANNPCLPPTMHPSCQDFYHTCENQQLIGGDNWKEEPKRKEL